MQRILNLFRRYVLPDLCLQCRKRWEEKMLTLQEVRQKDRELRPKLVTLQRNAARFCDELLALPPEKRLKKIRRTRHRLRSRPLAEELLLRSRRRIHFAPREAIHLAELAFEVALTLIHPKALELSGGMSGIADLQALALAYQANGYRVACDFENARSRFAIAEGHLQRGSGDPLVFAEILCLKASYSQTRRLFPSALHLLEQAEEIYRELEEDHLRGRLLVQKAAVLAESGDLQASLEAHLESCALIDATRDPQLAASAFHNLARAYCLLEDFETAGNVLRDSEELFFEVVEEGSSLHLYRQWTLAKVAQGEDRVPEAEALLQEVRQGFEHLGTSFNVALVLLDLAELYTLEGRIDEVAAIAEQTHAALEAHDLHQEAAQALVVFLTAAKKRQAALATIRTTAQLLHRYRHCTRMPS